MSRLELEAKALWHSWASWRGFGLCDGCGERCYLGRNRPRGRRLCLDCFEFTREGRAFARRVGR